MTGDLLTPKVILSPEVIDAQSWYEKQEANTKGIRIVLFNGERATPSWPDWRLTFSEENAQYKILGVDLSKTVPKKRSIRNKENGAEEQEMYQERFSVTNGECTRKFNETGDSRYLVNSIRLIIRTNKETNEREAFVMLVIPDLSYLEMHLDAPFKDFTYLKRGEAFNGFVHYYRLDGSYTNGWKYIDGKAHRIVTIEQKFM